MAGLFVAYKHTLKGRGACTGFGFTRRLIGHKVPSYDGAGFVVCEQARTDWVEQDLSFVASCPRTSLAPPRAILCVDLSVAGQPRTG